MIRVLFVGRLQLHCQLEVIVFSLFLFTTIENRKQTKRLLTKMKSTTVAFAAVTQLLISQEASSFGIGGSITTKTSFDIIRPLNMVSRDELMRPHFQASVSPTTRPAEMDMGQIVECADGSENCSIEEMTSMIEELDRMNSRCKDQHQQDQQDCNLEVIDARETIEDALKAQIDLKLTQNKMKDMNIIHNWSSTTAATTDGQNASSMEDHSFDHFVDYRAIGEYESH